MTPQLSMDGDPEAGHSSPVTSGGWTELADAVKARRVELKLSQAELAARAGVSESTVRSIEAERRAGYSAKSLRGLASALGWSLDSIERVRSGLPPAVESEPTGVEQEVAGLRQEVKELRTLIEQLVDQLPDRP